MHLAFLSYDSVEDPSVESLHANTLISRNGASGVTNTVGGVVGAVGRGVGETVTGVTGSYGKPVGDGIKDVAEGVEGGAAKVASGVKRAGEGQHGPLR